MNNFVITDSDKLNRNHFPGVWSDMQTDG